MVWQVTSVFHLLKPDASSAKLVSPEIATMSAYQMLLYQLQLLQLKNRLPRFNQQSPPLRQRLQ